MIIQSTKEATREELIQRINELQSQVNMFDKAYTGAIQESKKWFDIAYDSIPKQKVRDKLEVINNYKCEIVTKGDLIDILNEFLENN